MTPEALPSAEQVLDKLREYLAHPEWVGPTLQPAELLVLFDHLDVLGEQARRADAIAERWWAPYVPHDGADRARAAVMAQWPAFYRLLVELPNPHTRGDDHDQ